MGAISCMSILTKAASRWRTTALGGTSSRTFYNRLWPDVLKGIHEKYDVGVEDMGVKTN